MAQPVKEKDISIPFMKKNQINPRAFETGEYVA